MRTGRELADELGITYRQVHHWTAQGHVIPVGGHIEGAERVLEFDGKEERILRLMAGLVKFGFKVSAAAEIAAQHVNSKERLSMVDIDGVGFLHIAG